MEIFKEFTFEAAHYLPNVPPGHKCGRLHGHSYRATVYLDGQVDAATGWVVDFAEISVAFASLHDQLDHRYLNEVEGLTNPTVENIAKWVFDRLVGALPLAAVAIREGYTNGVVYRGEDGESDPVLRDSQHRDGA